MREKDNNRIYINKNDYDSQSGHLNIKINDN